MGATGMLQDRSSACLITEEQVDEAKEVVSEFTSSGGVSGMERRYRGSREDGIPIENDVAAKMAGYVSRPSEAVRRE